MIKEVEALLFASGKPIDIEFLQNLIGAKNKEIVIEALNKLKEKHNENDSSLMIIDEGKNWKITVREKYLPLVRKIIADTELSKTVMETLAIVAWKSPVLQSDVITIRTNKAYDHIGELLETGFITKEKHGRSFILKVTNKFFDYFDVEGTKGIKEMFSKIKEIIPQKRVDDFKEEPKEIIPDHIGDLEVVDTKPDNSVKEAEDTLESEHLGKLEVYEEKTESQEPDEDNLEIKKDLDNDQNESIDEISDAEKTKELVKELLDDDSTPISDDEKEEETEIIETKEKILEE